MQIKTPCKDCGHQEVCKLKEDFANAQDGIKNSSIGGIDKYGDNWNQDIKNIKWIDVVVSCTHYYGILSNNG